MCDTLNTVRLCIHTHERYIYIVNTFIHFFMSFLIIHDSRNLTNTFYNYVVNTYIF